MVVSARLAALIDPTLPVVLMFADASAPSTISLPRVPSEAVQLVIEWVTRVPTPVSAVNDPLVIEPVVRLLIDLTFTIANRSPLMVPLTREGAEIVPPWDQEPATRD